MLSFVLKDRSVLSKGNKPPRVYKNISRSTTKRLCRLIQTQPTVHVMGTDCYIVARRNDLIDWENRRIYDCQWLIESYDNPDNDETAALLHESTKEDLKVHTAACAALIAGAQYVET